MSDKCPARNSATLKKYDLKSKQFKRLKKQRLFQCERKKAALIKNEILEFPNVTIF